MNIPAYCSMRARIESRGRQHMSNIEIIAPNLQVRMTDDDGGSTIQLIQIPIIPSMMMRMACRIPMNETRSVESRPWLIRW